MKIVFFGSSSYVIPIIEVLKTNFDLALVITTEKPNLASKGVPLRGYSVIGYCAKNNIKCIPASSLSDENTKYKIQNTKATLAVLADFGLIIPKEIINAFPKGIINIHPSLLPKYRGPSPVQTTLLNGEKETGVSIMKLDEEIDHGPILKQVKARIYEDDTAESLYKKLFEEGANLLPEVINQYVKGDLNPIAQNHKEATFTNSLSRQDGYVKISNFKTQMSNLKNKIRAYAPWPGVWTKTKINGKEKIIKFLPEDRIQVEGKKPMTYKDFANGYPEVKEIIENLL